MYRYRGRASAGPGNMPADSTSKRIPLGKTFMPRKQGSRHAAHARRQSYRSSRNFRSLVVESLEPRQLLSASRFMPGHVVIPHAGTTISGYTPAQIRAAYGFNSVSFGSTPADGRGQTIAII